MAVVANIADLPNQAALLKNARNALNTVCDPEIPVLTIEDLGVLRDVAIDDDGRVNVTITPTYSGCPAMNTISMDVQTALAAAGFENVNVKLVLAPAWTTDWMSDEGRQKLLEYGIAPPAKGGTRGSLFGEAEIACPQCGSKNTEKLSEFGSTACKALYRCKACMEPFDYFKCL